MALGYRQVFARRAGGARQRLGARCARGGGLLQRGGEALGAHRLQQIVERIQIERVDRMLVMRCDEDHRRRVLEAAEMTRELEAVHSGHADVEQQHLRVARGQSLERLEAVARLAGDLVRQVGRDVLQELAQALARRRFVVSYEDADHVWWESLWRITLASP